MREGQELFNGRPVYLKICDYPHNYRWENLEVSFFNLLFRRSLIVFFNIVIIVICFLVVSGISGFTESKEFKMDDQCLELTPL